MKNSKKGKHEDSSSDDEDSSSDEEKEEKQKVTHKKKGNGHKPNCGCPICKNMKKSKKGGDEPDEENQIGDIEEGQVKANPNLQSNEIPASDGDYDALDAAEKGQAGPNVVGGTRKRRGSRKSNGHKPNCGCPICKNMRKGKNTRRNKKRSNRRR
jgi:hypothetical protein